MMIAKLTDRPSFPKRLAMTAGVLCLSLLMSTPALTRQGSNIIRVERFQISHRDPAAIRDALTPGLGSREEIGVIGDWLIVAATDSSRDRIREQLQELDTPIRSVEVTLSFELPTPDESDGIPEDTAPEPTIRNLVVEAGQLVRLDLPGSDHPQDAQEPRDEATRQLSLRLDTDGRRLRLSHTVHAADREVDPATGIQQAVETNQWHSLGEGITIRLRPRN